MERLLDEAGQRAQEVERGAAQAVEETAAVAAEEGEVAVAAEGVGGAFGYLGGLAEGAAALAPTAGEVAGTLAGAAGVYLRVRRQSQGQLPCGNVRAVSYLSVVQDLRDVAGDRSFKHVFLGDH